MNSATCLQRLAPLVGALLLSWLAAASAQAQTHLPASAPLACLILPDKVSEIGSPVVGVLATVEVERGDFVRKGQIIARLRADVERANTNVARSRADAQADLRGAEAAEVYAQQQVERIRQLVQQNFMSPAAAEKAESEHEMARQRVMQAREQQRTSGEEVSLYQAQWSQRVVRSPIDGLVVERYMHPGERVEEKPLIKVASITPLRVELVAPTALFGSLQIGQEASVMPELPGAAARSAKIVQIDKVLDPASNTFRLRLALPNDDASLPAGLRCKVDLGLKNRAAVPAEPPRLAPVGTSAEAAASVKAMPVIGPVATRR